MGFEKINEDTYVCDDGHVRFFLIVPAYTPKSSDGLYDAHFNRKEA